MVTILKNYEIVNIASFAYMSFRNYNCKLSGTAEIAQPLSWHLSLYSLYNRININICNYY